MIIRQLRAFLAGPFLLILGYGLLPSAQAATVHDGVDSDGDEYRIRLVGPGAIINPSLESLEVTGTDSSSMLSVRVTSTGGDGAVHVASIDSHDHDLGHLIVEGDLAALAAGALQSIQADSFGLQNDPNQISINGNLGRLTAAGGASGVSITIAGNAGTISLGTLSDPETRVSQTTVAISGALSQLTVNQSLTNQSSIHVGQAASTITLRQSLFQSDILIDSNLERLAIGGLVGDDCLIDVLGHVNTLEVSKALSDSEIIVSGKLRSARFGRDVIRSDLSASSIESLTITDNLDASRIATDFAINNLQIGDMSSSQLSVGGYLGSVRIDRSLLDSTLSVYEGIGQLYIFGDVFESLIIAGVAFGADFTLDSLDSRSGYVSVDRVLVMGQWVDTSLAVGVDPVDATNTFGNGDDTSFQDDQGTATIGQVTILGAIGASGRSNHSYAITAADDTGTIIAAGRTFTGITGMAVQSFD